MSSKHLLLVLALFGFALPASGCGTSHKAGVATGVDEESPPLTKEEEDAERAHNRKNR